MKYRRFGRTGWTISEIGYGMWGMGEWTGSQDEESSGSLQRAVDLGSNSADARLRLAGLLIEDGKPDIAVRICQDTVQLNPYSPTALLRLARTYSVLGDHQKAVSTLERLLGFDPGNEAARRALDTERNASARP